MKCAETKILIAKALGKREGGRGVEWQEERGRGDRNLCIIIMTGLGKAKQVKSEEKKAPKRSETKLMRPWLSAARVNK